MRISDWSSDVCSSDLLVYCLWIEDENLTEAKKYPAVAQRIAAVKALRLASPDKSANQMADRAHQFREMRHAQRHTIILPRITSENRQFLPVGIIDASGVVSSQSFALYDEPILLLSIIASRLQDRKSTRMHSSH